jgi:hypothetical protein
MGRMSGKWRSRGAECRVETSAKSIDRAIILKALG